MLSVNDLLRDTWASRDFPLLKHVAAAFDAEGSVSAQGLTELTGMSQADVSGALRALDGVYLKINWFNRAAGIAVIVDITPAARRAVGMWPTAESITEQLLATLDEQIENSGADQDKRSKLIKMRNAIGGAARDLFIEVTGSVMSKLVTGS
jgi:hypothetical protein